MIKSTMIIYNKKRLPKNWESLNLTYSTSISYIIEGIHVHLMILQYIYYLNLKDQ